MPAIPLLAYLDRAMLVAELQKFHYNKGERESAANYAAWQAWEKQVPLSQVRTMVRRRQIDAWRLERGKNGKKLPPISLDAELNENGASLHDVIADEEDIQIDETKSIINSLNSLSSYLQQIKKSYTL